MIRRYRVRAVTDWWLNCHQVHSVAQDILDDNRIGNILRYGTAVSPVDNVRYPHKWLSVDYQVDREYTLVVDLFDYRDHIEEGIFYGLKDDALKDVINWMDDNVPDAIGTIKRELSERIGVGIK